MVRVAATAIAVLGAALILYSSMQAPSLESRVLRQQAPEPVPKSTSVSELIQNYITEMTVPVEGSEEDFSSILSNNLIKSQSQEITVERSMIEKPLPIIAGQMPVKISAADIAQLVEYIKTSEESQKIFTFSTESADSFTKDGFVQTIQVLFVLFPTEQPTKVKLAIKGIQRKGAFLPITKTVVEKVCTKKYFGFVEECHDVVKTVQTPRQIDEEGLEKAKAYIRAKLLLDLKSTSSITIVTGQN